MTRSPELFMDLETCVHVFLLLDNSAAMAGAPLQALNGAVREITAAVRGAAARGMVRDCFHVLTLGDGAAWLWDSGSPRGLRGDELAAAWADLTPADGRADLPGAVRTLLPAMGVERLGHDAFPPVMVLVGGGGDVSPEEAAAAAAALDLHGPNTRIAVQAGPDSRGALADFASLRERIEYNDFGFAAAAGGPRRLVVPARETAGFFRGFMRGCSITS